MLSAFARALKYERTYSVHFFDSETHMNIGGNGTCR